MANTPSWATYARFQYKLSRSFSSTVPEWGLEAALNLILDPEFSPDRASEEDFRRADASAARKRRDHLSRFLVSMDEDFEPVDGKDSLAQIMARQALDTIAENVGRADRHLLSVIGEGYGYGQAARTLGQTTNALRTRMLRLRGKYAYLKT
ncbi:MAG: hypothetical protein M0038_22150 [Pseudomonadota bacterium]|jgi:hypothetical protein|nr:hypothetical protein [Pseudomonadota bacterium]